MWNLIFLFYGSCILLDVCTAHRLNTQYAHCIKLDKKEQVKQTNKKKEQISFSTNFLLLCNTRKYYCTFRPKNNTWAKDAINIYVFCVYNGKPRPTPSPYFVRQNISNQQNNIRNTQIQIHAHKLSKMSTVRFTEWERKRERDGLCVNQSRSNCRFKGTNAITTSIAQTHTQTQIRTRILI